MTVTAYNDASAPSPVPTETSKTALRQQFERGLAKISGVTVSDSGIARCLEYLELLQHWNSRYNLTGFKTDKQRVSHILLESIIMKKYLPEGLRVLDFGSGAGIPGMVLALVDQGRHYTLLDRSEVRCDFLFAVRRQLALKHVTVICKDIRQWHDTQKPDIILARAVMPLRPLLKIVVGHCGSNTQLMLSKGPSWRVESAPSTPPFSIVKEHCYSVPGISSKRYLLQFRAAGDPRAA